MAESVVYYSAADLAQRYHVHKITIFKWAALGVLPPGELVGPNTRRWRSDLIEEHEAQRAKATQE